MKGKKKSFAEKIKNEGWMKIDCHPLAVWFGSTIVTVCCWNYSAENHYLVCFILYL